MVEAELVQDGGVEVVDVDSVVDGLEAEVVGFAVGQGRVALLDANVWMGRATASESAEKQCRWPTTLRRTLLLRRLYRLGT